MNSSSTIAFSWGLKSLKLESFFLWVRECGHCYSTSCYFAYLCRKHKLYILEKHISRYCALRWDFLHGDTHGMFFDLLFVYQKILRQRIYANSLVVDSDSLVAFHCDLWNFIIIADNKLIFVHQMILELEYRCRNWGHSNSFLKTFVTKSGGFEINM